MSLSVCLLTRDEAHNLPRALDSVVGLAEEVIVADTGSRDATVRVARDLGARVIEHDWQDDFARGRDHALTQASGDWILWLNPDEELLAASRDVVRQCMANPQAFAFYGLIEQVERADQQKDFVAVTNARLFRKHADLHSVGRLHPRFEPSLEMLAARQGLMVFPAAVVIRRYAYLSPLTEDKLRWATRLLEKELADRPGQLHYLIEYGQTLLLLHEPRGHDVLAQAIEMVRKSAAASQPEVSTIQKLLDYVLTAEPAAYRGSMNKDEARSLALRWFPESPPLLWRMAEHAFVTKDYLPASDLLKRLVKLGRTGGYDHSQAFDPAIIGELAQLNLGVCLTRLGNYEQAERCLLPLLGHPRVGDQAGRSLAAAQILRAKKK